MMNALILSRLEGTVDKNGHGYTVTEMAKRAGISRQATHKILNGENMPKVDTAIRIARYISELFGYEVTVEDIWLTM